MQVHLHSQKGVVIFALTKLEESREMDRKISLAEEHQRNQQSTHASVAIDERVNSFKLRMNDWSAGEDTDPGEALRIWFIVNEPVQLSHESWNFRWRRRNEPGVFDLHPPDEILDTTQATWESTGVPPHELSVERTDKVDVERAASLRLYMFGTQHIRVQVVQRLIGISIGDCIRGSCLYLVQ